MHGASAVFPEDFRGVFMGLPWALHGTSVGLGVGLVSDFPLPIGTHGNPLGLRPDRLLSMGLLWELCFHAAFMDVGFSGISVVLP